MDTTALPLMILANDPASAGDMIGIVIWALVGVSNVSIYAKYLGLDSKEKTDGGDASPSQDIIHLPPSWVCLGCAIAWLVMFIGGRMLFADDFALFKSVFATETYPELGFDAMGLLSTFTAGIFLNAICVMWPAILLISRRRRITGTEIACIIGAIGVCLYLWHQLFSPVAPYILTSS